ALQVIRAASQPGGEPRQRGMPVDVREIYRRPLHFLDPRIGHQADVRFAALARPEPGALGVSGHVEERHAIAARTTARTRRTAVDSRRADGVDEEAVGAAVAAEDGAPARRFIQMLGRLNGCGLGHAPSLYQFRDPRYPTLAIKLSRPSSAGATGAG